MPRVGTNLQSLWKEKLFRQVMQTEQEKYHAPRNRSGFKRLGLHSQRDSKTQTIYAVKQHQQKEQLCKNANQRKTRKVSCGLRSNCERLASRIRGRRQLIKPTNRALQMWNKTEVRPKGMCRLTLRNPKNKKKYSVEFMVVKENSTPLPEPK